jgi:hypothetical protein
MSTARYIPTVDTAKIIRQELARAFPGLKCSVRSRSYSGGSHVSISWTDGPSTRQVDRVIGRFSGKTFDGRDDSTHYHDTEWQGERVHFAGSAPSTSRHITTYDDWYTKAFAMIRARCRLDSREGWPGEWFGNHRVDDLARGMVWAADFREAEPLERAFRIVVLSEREGDAS